MNQFVFSVSSILPERRSILGDPIKERESDPKCGIDITPELNLGEIFGRRGRNR